MVSRKHCDSDTLWSYVQVAITLGDTISIQVCAVFGYSVFPKCTMNEHSNKLFGSTSIGQNF